MIALDDGRAMTARRNGFCFVQILDNVGDQHSIDFNHAGELADALEHGRQIKVPTVDGRVLELHPHGLRKVPSPPGAPPTYRPEAMVLGDVITRPLAQAPGRAPRGPWILGEEQWVALADEIRRVVSG